MLASGISSSCDYHRPSSRHRLVGAWNGPLFLIIGRVDTDSPVPSLLANIYHIFALVVGIKYLMPLFFAKSTIWRIVEDKRGSWIAQVHYDIMPNCFPSSSSLPSKNFIGILGVFCILPTISLYVLYSKGSMVIRKPQETILPRNSLVTANQQPPYPNQQVPYENPFQYVGQSRSTFPNQPPPGYTELALPNDLPSSVEK